MRWCLTSGTCPRRWWSIRPDRWGPRTCEKADASSPSSIAWLATRRLWATVGGIFSDLLLHDMGQSLSDSGSSYGLDGPDTPEGPQPSRVADRRRSGAIAIPVRICTTAGAEPGRSGRAARRAGEGFGPSVLRTIQPGAGPGRGVLEIAGCARGGGLRPASCWRRKWSFGSSGKNSASPKTRCGGDGKGPSPTTSRNGVTPCVAAAHSRPRSGPGSRFPSLKTWKKWAKSRARSRSTRRLLAWPTARTRVVWPPRESPSSKRGTGDVRSR